MKKLPEIEARSSIEFLSEANAYLIPLGYTIQELIGEDEIFEVANLDKELFGQHQSIPYEGFCKIVDNGGSVFGVRDTSGNLVAEASLVVCADSVGLSQIERDLPDELAYCDGAAVSESARGIGLQKWLLRAREQKAVDLGKVGISASVRHQNVPSIRSLLNEGYIIMCHADNYYGSEISDSRLFLAKILDGKGMTMTGSSNKARDRITEIEVGQSDIVDQGLIDLIRELLSSGQVGFSYTPLEGGAITI